MEGYGSRSVHDTNGSGCGSGRPKNIKILRIRTPDEDPQHYEKGCPLPSLPSRCDQNSTIQSVHCQGWKVNKSFQYNNIIWTPPCSHMHLYIIFFLQDIIIKLGLKLILYTGYRYRWIFYNNFSRCPLFKRMSQPELSIFTRYHTLKVTVNGAVTDKRTWMQRREPSWCARRVLPAGWRWQCRTAWCDHRQILCTAYIFVLHNQSITSK